MAPKSVFTWLCLLMPILFVACTPSSRPSPTADQKSISTAVAATLNAASTATQQALLTSRPTQAFTTTPAPTQTHIVPPSATPTITPIPTILTTPSVELVAYTKYSDVHLWSLAIGSTRLTDMHDVVSVRLSTDGSLVAFKRQDPEETKQQELWVVNSVGVPNPIQLVSSDDLAALIPANPSQNILGYGVYNYEWRPGTHQLAYNTMVLHEGPGFGSNRDLRLVDADTLLKTVIFNKGEGGLFYYSPDGNQIALSKSESISLVKADGSNLRPDLLTYPNVITYSDYEYQPQPIWAQDSSALGVAIPPHDPLGDPAPLTGLWRIPLDGSPAVLLSSVPAIAFAWPDDAFSPDLTLVAYSSDAIGAEPDLRDLHISNPDGTGDGIYASGESLQFISWSPDSQHFLYKIQGSSAEGIYIGGPAGSPIQLIADSHSVGDILWLDGTRIVYLVKKTDQWELHLSNLKAEELALIDTIPDTRPHFDVVNYLEAIAH